jgi:hypothetical protein
MQSIFLYVSLILKHIFCYNVDNANDLEPKGEEEFIFQAEQLKKLSDISGALKSVEDGLRINNSNRTLLEHLHDDLSEIEGKAEAVWFDIS